MQFGVCDWWEIKTLSQPTRSMVTPEIFVLAVASNARGSLKRDNIVTITRPSENTSNQAQNRQLSHSAPLTVLTIFAFRNQIRRATPHHTFPFNSLPPPTTFLTLTHSLHLHIPRYHHHLRHGLQSQIPHTVRLSAHPYLTLPSANPLAQPRPQRLYQPQPFSICKPVFSEFLPRKIKIAPSITYHVP